MSAAGSLTDRLVLARAALVRGWLRGDRPTVEVVLLEYDDLATDAAAVVELVHLEAMLRQGRGEAPHVEEYLGRFLTQSDGIRARFALDPALETPAAKKTVGPPADPEATVAPQPVTLSPGEVPYVPGYEILGELGRGGMGVVYKARQVGLDRVVALKMILAGSHAGAVEMARFRKEAEAIGRLTHPNIVQIYEIGEAAVGSGSPCPYFSLEYCDGGTLADRLGSPMDPQEAAALVETLAAAMAAAHAKGVIHRDLKPANVLLCSPVSPRPGEENRVPEGRDYIAKLTDFGLAKKLDEQTRTQTGTVLGTPAYMAPEQAQGKTKGVGPQADVHALGAILYECLTGRPPFLGPTTLDTLLQVLEQEAVPPRQHSPAVPRDLEVICLKCLQKLPEHRYATAAELADDLARFRADEPIKARPPGPLRQLDRAVRKHPLVIVTWLVALAALAAGGSQLPIPFFLAPGVAGLTVQSAVYLALPLILLILVTMGRGHGGVSLLAAIPLGLLGWAAWRWALPEALGPRTDLLAGSAAGLLAVLVGNGWARGWKEAAFWAVALAAGYALVGGPRFAQVVPLGLFAGGCVWLVRWALNRESGLVALGALGGLLLGLFVAEERTQLWAIHFRTHGLPWASLPVVAGYVTAGLTFAGAVVAGLLSPRAQRLPGVQVVPSANSTSTSSKSARAAALGGAAGN